MEYANAAPTGILAPPRPAMEPAPIRYCLYSRKSTEQDEKQALSIDSQIKEMLAIAARENLNIVETKRESHSAKDTGQRPMFNEMIRDIREGKFNGVLTWHPDRLARNAGDLGALVDLMDQKLLHTIRTYSQSFSNNPNEKFLLMILGSQAKLENDNKSVNVKRGLRTRCEMGLWPAQAPTGYVNSPKVHEKGIVYVDPKRAPIVRQMFEKAAYEDWSGRKIFYWLKEIGFRSINGKPLTLSNVYLLLRNHFYYGQFEYPRGGSKWYQGKHIPIIDKRLFDLVQEKITIQAVRKNKEFAFTKLMRCGICGSGITADEKFKKLQRGKVRRYVYYGCTKFYDKECKCGHLEEDILIMQLENLVDRLDLDETGIKKRIKDEVERYKKFQAGLLKTKTKVRVADVDIRNYAKYILRDGSIYEKRELLSCLKSRIILKDKQIYLA